MENARTPPLSFAGEVGARRAPGEGPAPTALTPTRSRTRERESRAWTDVGPLDAIPPLRARTVRLRGVAIAVFRTADDQVFALHDRCPHKGGPLSQGIVHGTSVTCPLHNWVIALTNGTVRAPDEGCVRTVPVRLESGRILLEITP